MAVSPSFQRGPVSRPPCSLILATPSLPASRSVSQLGLLLKFPVLRHPLCPHPTLLDVPGHPSFYTQTKMKSCPWGLAPLGRMRSPFSAPPSPGGDLPALLCIHFAPHCVHSWAPPDQGPLTTWSALPFYSKTLPRKPRTGQKGLLAICWGPPGGTLAKNPSTKQETWTFGFDPWIGKVPWRRKRQPTPVFLPEKSHGQRSLAGYSPWRCKRAGRDLMTTQQP